MPEKCAYKEHLDAQQQKFAVAQSNGTADTWYQKMWRPLVGKIFLVIVVFDFVIMPFYIEVSNQKEDFTDVIAAIQQIEDKEIRQQFMQKVELEKRVWSPLTTLGGGLFFVVLAHFRQTRSRQRRFK